MSSEPPGVRAHVRVAVRRARVHTGGTPNEARLTFLSFLLAPSVLADDGDALRRGVESDAGWEEVDRQEVDGVGEVVIRHKAVAGEECLEAATTARASVDTLLAAAMDVTNQARWSSWKLPAAAKLSGGATSFDYYQVLDNPPPVADRVWFLRGRAERRGDVGVFAWDQIDGATAYPEAWASVHERFPGVVPTRVNVGAWTFTPAGDATAVRYRICTDAGGSIPRWVGEIAARSTLPTNVADLVREALRRTRG